jgi:hypothetical protein
VENGWKIKEKENISDTYLRFTGGAIISIHTHTQTTHNETAAPF